MPEDNIIFDTITIGTSDLVFGTAGGAAIRRTVTQAKKSQDDLFAEAIGKRVSAGESVGKDEYRKFMRIIKRRGHIDRSSRQSLHKIKDEPGKSMSDVSVDDLVPV